MSANLILFIVCIVLVTDYTYDTCIPTPTLGYHTLQGLDSFCIEDSTLGVCVHMTTYIVNNDVLIILTMNMSAA
jgi:hypothetical protein